MEDGKTNSVGDPSAVEFEAQYDTVAGLDVHKRSITACVLGPSGKCEMRTFGTFKNDIIAMVEWLISCSVKLAAMESTSIYWSLPCNILREYGVDVIVANAYHIKNVPGRKTDTADAKWIAILAKSGLLSKSRILSQEDSETRDLSRLRKKIIDDQGNYKNRVTKLLTKAGFAITQVVTDVFGKTGRIVIDGLLESKDPESILADITDTIGYRLKAPQGVLLNALQGEMSGILKTTIRELMGIIDHLGERAEYFDAVLEKKLIERGQEEEMDLLQTMPGVSETVAKTVLAEFGSEPEADFGSADALASWAGLCPGNNESGGKRRSGKTTHGNNGLKTVMCEASISAAKTESLFKDKHQNNKLRLGFKKSIMANACKMLKIMYHMLTRMVPYEDHRVDYDEMLTKKNAPRWIRKLAKYHLLRA